MAMTGFIPSWKGAVGVAVIVLLVLYAANNFDSIAKLTAKR